MDQKSTDKGWASMRSLLDREMPEKRRRRFAWWWFCLLLLPIAGYGGWHFGGNSTQNPAIPVNPSTQTATIVDANVAPEQSATPLPISPIKAADAPALIPKTNQGKSKASAANNTFSQQTDAESLLKPSLFSGQTREKGLELSSQASVSPLETPDNLSHSISAEIASIYPLDILPTNVQNVDSQQENNTTAPKTYASIITPPIKKDAFHTWTFGATTAISSEQFSAINGFSTGATVDWKFAKKWGLRTGLAYNIHSPQEEFRPVASVQSNEYTSNVGGAVVIVDIQTGVVVQGASTNFYNDSLSGNVLIPVNRLQRLEVPMTVFWQPLRPLKVIGGLSLTRTLSTQSDNQNYTQDYILKLVDQKAEDGASKLSSSELDNWSADGMLGLGLKIGRSFELGCSVKMPLNKFSGLSPKESRSNNAGFGSLGDEVRSTRKQSGPVFSLSGTLFF